MARPDGAAARTILAAALLVLVGAAPAADPPTATIGAPAPALPPADLDGARLDLAALRGKVVVVDFWATWCVPCRAQVPRLAALEKKHGGRLVVVGISLDDDAAPVRSFRRETGMTYRVAMGDAKVAERWGGVLGLPVAFVVDREGKLRARHEGADDLPAVERDVEKLAK